MNAITKEMLRKLAASDNIEVCYSGKRKLAFLKFRGKIIADFADKYRRLFECIGYQIQTSNIIW